MGILYLSPSQMGTFFGCPAAYYQRYILGRKVPPGIALHVGYGFHVGGEHNFIQKRDSRKDLPKSVVVEAAIDGFERRLKKDGIYIDRGESPKDVVGKGKDTLVKMTNVLSDEVAPLIQPVAVELPFEFTREGLESVIFTGRIDTVVENHDVVDLKSSKDKWPKGKEFTEVQPEFYLEGARQHGAKPDHFVYHIVTKQKTPQHQIVTTTRDESDLKTLDSKARIIVAMRQAGLFPPCDPGHWRCSPKWCGYYVWGCKYKSERDKNRVLSIG